MDNDLEIFRRREERKKKKKKPENTVDYPRYNDDRRTNKNVKGIDT